MNYVVLQNFLKNRKRKVVSLEGLKPAAGLVPLVFHDKIYMLLTKRALHLNHHPGEISFPGGRIESKDVSGEVTAIRETEEEVGIKKKEITILGAIDDVVSVTKFHLTPFVGVVPYKNQYSFDKNEVEQVYLIPISFFLVTPKIINYKWNGEDKPSYVYDYKDIRIFGVTAYIIKNFIAILNDSGFIEINKSFIF